MTAGADDYLAMPFTRVELDSLEGLLRKQGRAICRLGTPHRQEATATGDTVNVAARIEASSKELGWTVVASGAVLATAGEGIQTGGMTSLDVRGKNACIDVAEITGLVTNVEDQRHGMATLTERAAEVRDAVRINSEITARAVKGALRSKLSAFKGTLSRTAASRCA